jgi:Cd2+-exporting ATPase
MTCSSGCCEAPEQELPEPTPPLAAVSPKPTDDNRNGDQDVPSMVSDGPANPGGEVAVLKGVAENEEKGSSKSSAACRDDCSGETTGKSKKDELQATCNEGCCSSGSPQQSDDAPVPSCCEGKAAPCCDQACVDRVALRECRQNPGTAGDGLKGKLSNGFCYLFTVLSAHIRCAEFKQDVKLWRWRGRQTMCRPRKEGT